MSQQIVPLDNSPNQTWQVSPLIDGATQTFFVALRYNEVANYWCMTIDDVNGNLLLDSVPLVTGVNILQQHAYLEIGSIFIINVSGTALDLPNNTDLGTDFVMVWADDPLIGEVLAGVASGLAGGGKGSSPYQPIGPGEHQPIF
jgi:hypothetical protein